MMPSIKGTHITTPTLFTVGILNGQLDFLAFLELVGLHRKEGILGFTEVHTEENKSQRDGKGPLMDKAHIGSPHGSSAATRSML